MAREDIFNYYNKIFDSKNVVISVNGDVSESVMINAFGSMFFDKKQPIFNYNNYQVTKLSSPKKFSKSIKDLQTAWLFLGWQTGKIEAKKDFVTLKIINTILGGGMSSRMYKNLREQDGLAYQLGSTYSPKVLGGFPVPRFVRPSSPGSRRHPGW